MTAKKDIVIAGDVSATNVLMAVFRGRECILEKRYFGGGIRDFKTQVVDDLLVEAGVLGKDVEKMVLAPAGVIEDGGRYCNLSNAPFELDACSFGFPTALINDFAAIAYAVSAHKNGERLDFRTLNHSDFKKGREVNLEKIAVVGAGTGFGQARLIYDDLRGIYVPVDSEGGHKTLTLDCDDEVERDLWSFLKRELGVDYPHQEAAICGDGLERIFRYFLTSQEIDREEIPLIRDCLLSDDSAAYIAEKGRWDWNSVFGQSLDVFFRLYGRATRDTAVHEKAQGGVYVAGGIMRKNLLTEGCVDKRIEDTFMEQFDSGASHREWVNNIPVYVIMDGRVGLKGAYAVATNPKYRGLEVFCGSK